MSPATNSNAPENLRPVYVLVGDEAYLRDRFSRQMLGDIPAAERSFSVFDFELSATPLDDILDQARTPSLMAERQYFFIRGVKELFSRTSAAADPGATPARKGGKKKHGGFPANVERFARESPEPPPAVLVLIADHLHLPADRQRLSLDDKSRLQRLESALGSFSEMVYCGRVGEALAAAEARQMAARVGAELAPEAARLLVQRLDSDLALAQTEVEKLALYALPEHSIPTEAVQTLVSGAESGSGFALAEAIAQAAPLAATGDGARHQVSRRRCFELLARIWAESGDGAAIGLVYQLSRAFTMAMILRQERVRDRSGLYRVLPEGLRPPGFAADQILAIGRTMDAAHLRLAIQLLHQVDVELRSSPPSARLVFERLLWRLTAPTGTKLAQAARL